MPSERSRRASPRAMALVVPLLVFGCRDAVPEALGTPELASSLCEHPAGPNALEAEPINLLPPGTGDCRITSLDETVLCVEPAGDAWLSEAVPVVSWGPDGTLLLRFTSATQRISAIDLQVEYTVDGLPALQRRALPDDGPFAEGDVTGACRLPAGDTPLLVASGFSGDTGVVALGRPWLSAPSRSAQPGRLAAVGTDLVCSSDELPDDRVTRLWPSPQTHALHALHLRPLPPATPPAALATDAETGESRIVEITEACGPGRAAVSLQNDEGTPLRPALASTAYLGDAFLWVDVPGGSMMDLWRLPWPPVGGGVPVRQSFRLAEPGSTGQLLAVVPWRGGALVASSPSRTRAFELLLLGRDLQPRGRVQFVWSLPEPGASFFGLEGAASDPESGRVVLLAKARGREYRAIRFGIECDGP